MKPKSWIGELVLILLAAAFLSILAVSAVERVSRHIDAQWKAEHSAWTQDPAAQPRMK